MQIASQVYGISTAKNGLIFFNDGSPAYLTKRFDYKKDGSKYQVEDFATLLGKTPEAEGTEFKISASYIDIANAIDQYVPSAKFEKIKFFELVVFNYAFSNADAHLKNFSLLETNDGDYVLSPAYDLLCTALHIDDGNLSLQGGLYEKDFEAPAFSKFGVYTIGDFILFAEKMGIHQKLSLPILEKYSRENTKVTELINRSFLSQKGKALYQKQYSERLQRFQMHL
jgi:serine/threonine-protein kinase HipA